jgi:hypothetical protein
MKRVFINSFTDRHQHSRSREVSQAMRQSSRDRLRRNYIARLWRRQ